MWEMYNVHTRSIPLSMYASKHEFCSSFVTIISSINIRFGTWILFSLLKAERKPVQTSLKESVSTFELSEDRTSRSQFNRSKTIACQTHIIPSDYTYAIIVHRNERNVTKRNESKPSSIWWNFVSIWISSIKHN